MPPRSARPNIVTNYGLATIRESDRRFVRKPYRHTGNIDLRKVWRQAPDARHIHCFCLSFVRSFDVRRSRYWISIPCRILLGEF